MRTLFALALVGLTAPAAFADTCTHQVTSAKPGWVAYKTTQKLAVEGSFTDTTMSPTVAAKTIPEAIQGVSMDIVPSSVDSGLDVRNKTIAEHYFAKFLPDTPFRASVTKVNGNDQSGTATLTVDINGVKRNLEFPYTVSAAGELTAAATMDMMDFSLGTAFDAIHTACKNLHMGPDGISKTWTEVQLKVTATLVKTCL